MGIFWIRKSSWVTFSLACAMVLVLLFFNEIAFRQAFKTLDRLGQLGAARTSIQELSRSIVDAETGQRGYLVTGRKVYREPYDNALKKIGETFTFLSDYYRAEPARREILDKLRLASDIRLSELALTIERFDNGNADAAREIVLSDIGKEQMETIRRLSGELLDYETRKIAVGRAEVYQLLQTDRIGVAVFGLLSLLGLLMYLRQNSKLWTQQRELQTAVQIERDRLEVEVINRTAQLTELADHLQNAREDERHRLARNLHDDLGALLTSVKLDAARIRSRLLVSSPENLELLQHMLASVNDAISLGRRIIEDLRPSALSNLGLVHALEILAQEFVNQSAIKVHKSLEPAKLSSNAELVVYRLVQEAITNISKYAKAANVWIDLQQHDDHVEVTVRDDGIGFDTEKSPGSAFGLVGMHYRVAAEGGRLSVVSRPGQGTKIQATLPTSSSLPKAN